ncbi:MAG: hypothetical protein JW748_08270 [Anaerolineales bacterium]|nr:hypothetical protein [Anaerolineales bacterium]
MIFFNRVPMLICAGSFVLLSGCQPAATPVPTGTPTDTPTFTATPTLTDTPTFTPTNTETQTATPTFTSTPPYNAPGTYRVFKCVGYYLAGAPISVRFCVTTVKVYDDYTMQFNVNWKVFAGGYRVTKYADTDNPRMRIEDNLGNSYMHFATGGCAAEIAIFQGEGDCNGWFLFHPAKPGATSFRFYDNDHIVFIDGIVLLQGDFPTPTAMPTPTLGSYNSPGTYWIYKCTNFIPQRNFDGAVQVTLCLNTVTINDKFEMRFNVNWKITYGWVNSWNKQSDANNYEIYLEDNLGNEYNHISTGGCAGQETFIVNHGTFGDCNGWFQFPPAEPGATSFRFVDSANAASIENIVLIPKKPKIKKEKMVVADVWAEDNGIGRG